MGHNRHMSKLDGVNAAHETSRKFIDDLGSIGIPSKEVKMAGGGAYPIGADNDTFMAQLTDHNRKKHNDVLAEHAEHLASRGMNVTTATYNCGHTRVNSMHRTSFGYGVHDHYDHTGNCESCRTSV